MGICRGDEETDGEGSVLLSQIEDIAHNGALANDIDFDGLFGNISW